MSDPTENIRRAMVQAINAAPGSREYLEEREGQVWDTSQLQEDYQVIGFAAPFVVVIRKKDSVRGSLTFQHSPRLYYHFVPDEVFKIGRF